MYKRLMFLVFVLAGLISLIAQENDSLPEKYVPKVIIEAEWGDGPGEFGIALWSSPPEGPGPLVVDKEGNIYISDLGNFVIRKFNQSGDFVKNLAKGKVILNMAVLNDTIYAIGLNDVNDRNKKIFLINKNNGELLFTDTLLLKHYFKDSYSFVNLKSKDDKIILRRKNVQYILRVEEGNVQIKRFPYKLRSILKQKVNSLKKDLMNFFLARDKSNNHFFGLLTLYKVDPEGNLLFKLKLPRGNYIGEYKIDKTYITEKGDIYYLYPTGKIIVKNWEKEFIPGKIQVIKWELQK